MLAQLVRHRDRNNLGIFLRIINFSAGLGLVACSSTHIWMAPMNSDTPWTKIHTPALQETVVTDLCIPHNHFRTHLINALLRGYVDLDSYAMDELLAIDPVAQLIHLKEASFVSDTIVEVIVEARCTGPEERKESGTTHEPEQVLECVGISINEI